MRYLKKPIVIDAIKFDYTHDGLDMLRDFCGSALGPVMKHRRIGAKAEAVIRTLKGGSKGLVRHIAIEGDWIIKGVSGEFYLCKPDIFEKTYEPVDD